MQEVKKIEPATCPACTSKKVSSPMMGKVRCGDCRATWSTKAKVRRDYGKVLSMGPLKKTP